ncbi:MAG: 2Fe-2S iron-sulfur cluster-binding protein [Ignavibacteriaceae bacterium]|jgi:NADH-quinone oxidoreductase subunit G|nr:2Fe-2S iron-sulfur cluster-binding protein [Ignavibacteriaceae bacterium]
MPKFQIDGKEFEFKNGQTVLEVALENGIDIPHFCYHPLLSISGNCRMCLVEIEKMPKLMISCSTLAAEGMVVHTQSERAINARKAVMEFFLINHPLDCPICDEAGECKLQDYTYQHSIGESRFTETKNLKEKRVPLGPYVMFDGDRCIACSRCIRFCDEIAKSSQLTFVKRGDRVTIETFPGMQLDNSYSLNVTDICPVGALTNRDFRFKARVWDMSATKSVCIGCSRGCNIEVWVRSNEIMRLTPRFNPDVNQYWMCDEGRLKTWKHVNSDTRINGPQLRKNGTLAEVGWDEAYAFAISELKNFNKDEIGIILSSSASMEDNYMGIKFGKSVLGAKYFGYKSKVLKGSGDDILITDDKAPNTFGLELLLKSFSVRIENSFEQVMSLINEGKIKALLVIEDDILSGSEELNKTLDRLDLLIVTASNMNKTAEKAHIIFAASTYAEKNGTFVNVSGRIQRTKPAVVTSERERSLDGFEMSRLDKFGTEWDKWGKVNKIEARASWKILNGLGVVMGQKLKYNMAEEVFVDLSKTIDKLSGLDYRTIGETGVQLKLTNTN